MTNVVVGFNSERSGYHYAYKSNRFNTATDHCFRVHIFSPIPTSPLGPGRVYGHISFFDSPSFKVISNRNIRIQKSKKAGKKKCPQKKKKMKIADEVGSGDCHHMTTRRKRRRDGSQPSFMNEEDMQIEYLTSQTPTPRKYSTSGFTHISRTPGIDTPFYKKVRSYNPVLEESEPEINSSLAMVSPFDLPKIGFDLTSISPFIFSPSHTTPIKPSSSSSSSSSYINTWFPPRPQNHEADMKIEDSIQSKLENENEEEEESWNNIEFTSNPSYNPPPSPPLPSMSQFPSSLMPSTLRSPSSSATKNSNKNAVSDFFSMFDLFKTPI